MARTEKALKQDISFLESQKKGGGLSQRDSFNLERAKDKLSKIKSFSNKTNSFGGLSISDRGNIVSQKQIITSPSGTNKVINVPVAKFNKTKTSVSNPQFFKTRTTIQSSNQTRDFELGLKPIELFKSDRFTNVRRQFNSRTNKWELKGNIDVPVSGGLSDVWNSSDVQKVVKLRSKGSGGVISSVPQSTGFFPSLSQKLTEKQVNLSQTARSGGGVNFKKSFGSIGVSLAGVGIDLASIGENIVRNPRRTISGFSSGIKSFTKEFKDNPRFFTERFGDELQRNPEKFIGQIVGFLLLEKGISNVAKAKPVKTVSVKVGKAINIGKNEFIVKVIIKTQVGVGKRAKILTTTVAQRFKVFGGKISFGKGVLAQEVKKSVTNIFKSSGIALNVGQKGKITLIKSIAKIKKTGSLRRSRLFNKQTFKKSLFKSESFAKSNSVVGSLKKDLLLDLTSTNVLIKTKLKVFGDTLYVFAERPLSSLAKSKLALRMRSIGLKVKYINNPQLVKLNKALSKIRNKVKGFKTINVDQSIGLTKISKQGSRVVNIPKNIKIKNIAKILNSRKISKRSLSSGIKELKSVTKTPKGFKWTQLKITDKVSAPILKTIKSGAKSKTVAKGLSRFEKSAVNIQSKLQAKLIKEMIKTNQLSLIQLGNLLAGGVISSAIYNSAIKGLISKSSSKAKAQIRIKAKAIQQSVKQKFKPATKTRSKQAIKQKSKSGQRQIVRTKVSSGTKVKSQVAVKLSSAQKSKVKSLAKLRSQSDTRTKLISPSPRSPVGGGGGFFPLPLIIPKFKRDKLLKGKPVKLNKAALNYLPSLRGLYSYNHRGKTITKAEAIRLLKKGLTGLEVRFVIKPTKKSKKRRKLTAKERKSLIARLKKARAVKNKGVKRKMVKQNKNKETVAERNARLKAMRKKFGLGEFKNKGAK